MGDPDADGDPLVDATGCAVAVGGLVGSLVLFALFWLVAESLMRLIVVIIDAVT